MVVDLAAQDHSGMDIEPSIGENNDVFAEDVEIDRDSVQWSQSSPPPDSVQWSQSPVWSQHTEESDGANGLPAAGVAAGAGAPGPAGAGAASTSGGAVDAEQPDAWKRSDKRRVGYKVANNM